MLTPAQKLKIKERFLKLKAILESYIPTRDAKGMIVAYTDISVHPSISPELGIRKNWKKFIEDYAKGRESRAKGVAKDRYSDLVFPDEYICQVLKYRCPYWLNTDKFGGTGEGYKECPEYITNFCCAAPNAGISDVSQPAPIYRRACVQRRCAERLAQYMLEHGETAPYVKDVVRYCKYTCHGYKECISDNIPECVLERVPDNPFGTYDPEYAKLPKTVYDQFTFCHKIANDITLDTIKTIDEIIKMCE